MAGFAGCYDAPTEYNAILDRVTAALGVTEVVRFGERRRGSGDVFEHLPLTHGVHCSSFYDRLQNPDDALYKAVIADTSGRPHLYITDGVQSDWQGRNPGPSVAQLKRFLELGRGLAILAFRSRFHGPAWSEQRQQMLGNVTSPHRPFYLFILAPSDSIVDDLMRSIPNPLLVQAERIRFAEDGVRCRADIAPKVAKFVSTQKPPWAMLKYEAVHAAPSIIQYNCGLRSDYPLQSVLPRSRAQFRRWLGSRFNAPEPLPLETFSPGEGVEGGGSSAVPIGIAIPVDGQTRYRFYEVRFDANPGDVTNIVTALSTDNDADRTSFDRTYRFSWLIEELARTHLARQSWVPFAFTLQYR